MGPDAFFQGLTSWFPLVSYKSWYHGSTDLPQTSSDGHGWSLPEVILCSRLEVFELPKALRTTLSACVPRKYRLSHSNRLPRTMQRIQRRISAPVLAEIDP